MQFVMKEADISSYCHSIFRNDWFGVDRELVEVTCLERIYDHVSPTRSQSGLDSFP